MLKCNSIYNLSFLCCYGGQFCSFSHILHFREMTHLRGRISIPEKGIVCPKEILKFVLLHAQTENLLTVLKPILPSVWS